METQYIISQNNLNILINAISTLKIGATCDDVIALKNQMAQTVCQNIKQYIDLQPEVDRLKAENTSLNNQITDLKNELAAVNAN